MQIRFEKKNKLVAKSCGAPAVLEQLKTWQSIFVGRTGVSVFFVSREDAKARRRQRQRRADCLAAARQFTRPVGRREVGADWRVRLFCRTRRREGHRPVAARLRAAVGWRRYVAGAVYWVCVAARAMRAAPMAPAAALPTLIARPVFWATICGHMVLLAGPPTMTAC